MSSQAQKKNIGDKLPSVKFANLVNSNSKIFDLRTSKTKLLLIDFWSTGCGTCISSMRSLAALKEKWKDDLTIIFLTFDDTAALRKFFIKRPDVKALKLPMIPIEKKWMDWFPFRRIPHVVWIGRDYKVEAITSSTMVTDQHIEEYMTNGKISLPEKKNLDPNASLLFPRYDQNLYFSSVFTGPVDGLSATYGTRNLPGNQSKLFVHNVNVRSMYFNAFRYTEFLKMNNYNSRILFHIKDSSIIEKDKWGDEKQFCYELIVPRGLIKNKKTIFEIYKQELNRFFGFRTEIIKKPSKVYLLSSTRPLTWNTEKNIERETFDEISYTCLDISIAPNFIESVLKDYVPVIYNGPPAKIPLTLKLNYASVQELNADLKKFGLEITIGEKDLEYLLVSDNSEK
jgi:thiol-disulfide isomerase/thioredoxin